MDAARAKATCAFRSSKSEKQEDARARAPSSFPCRFEATGWSCRSNRWIHSGHSVQACCCWIPSCRSCHQTSRSIRSIRSYRLISNYRTNRSRTSWGCLTSRFHCGRSIDSDRDPDRSCRRPIDVRAWRSCRYLHHPDCHDRCGLAARSCRSSSCSSFPDSRSYRTVRWKPSRCSNCLTSHSSLC